MRALGSLFGGFRTPARCQRGSISRGCRDDQRQRCPGAKGHPQLVWHTKHDENLIEDGNHNGPSSDAEGAREETGQASGGPQHHRQKNQMTHGSNSASSNIVVSTGTRARGWMASTIWRRAIVTARRLASH